MIEQGGNTTNNRKPGLYAACFLLIIVCIGALLAVVFVLPANHPAFVPLVTLLSTLVAGGVTGFLRHVLG